jgi:hypothetical protein
MLRSEHVAIVDILRGTVRPTVDQMPRGYVNIDAAHLHAAEYDYADGQLVGTALGIPIYRSDALADGKYAYIDEAGTTIASN